MNELEAGEGSYRAEIATRNRRRIAQARERRLSFAVVGLLAYSAFSNFVGAFLSLGGSKLDVGAGLVLGALYSFGVYRTWSKDDMRWWPVAVPAGLSLALVILATLAGIYLYGAFILNVILLVLVPLRRKAAAAVAKL